MNSFNTFILPKLLMIPLFMTGNNERKFGKFNAVFLDIANKWFNFNKAPPNLLYDIIGTYPDRMRMFLTNLASREEKREIPA